MSPARVCPKHGKQFPCGPCRKESAQKTAQVGASIPFELVVPSTAILEETKNDLLSPETKQKIKDSLATAPHEVPEKRNHLAVLKSLPHPVVPSADPAAPYGRDQNDQVIKPERADQKIAAGLSTRPDLKAGACPHKSNPLYCLHCGTANNRAAPIANNLQSPARQREIRERTSCKHGNLSFNCIWCEPIPEDKAVTTLRRQFGIESERDLKLEALKHLRNRKFVFFPEVLGISRGQLIGMLELDAGTRTINEQKTEIKDRSEIEQQITALERIPRQIEKRKRLIVLSEELIESWFVHVMKIQVKRGERNPEDIPDQKLREAWKYKERKRIERCESKIVELRKSLSHLDDLKRRATAWGSNQNDFETKSIPVQVPTKFWQRFVPPRNDNRKPGPSFNIYDYIALLNEYDLLKDVSRRLREFPEIDEWRYFENEVVFQAIEWGLYRPTKQAVEKYPELMRYEHDPEQDDQEEHQLIIKTGGAEIGGSIYGNGGRKLKSFDKHRPFGSGPGVPGEYGGAPQDNWYGGLDSGDLGDRPGDE